jgi:hypothetical protein
MMHAKTIVLFLITYTALEFTAGFFGLDSAHLIAGVALYLACRSGLRIDELEKKQ